MPVKFHYKFIFFAESTQVRVRKKGKLVGIINLVLVEKNSLNFHVCPKKNQVAAFSDQHKPNPRK